MIKVLIINNNDKCYKKMKDINDENLYKKCGFKSNDNFVKLFSHNRNNNIDYEFWGKNDGKCNVRYNFNNIVYYNKLLIIKKENNEFINLLEEDYDYIIDKINYSIDKKYDKDEKDDEYDKDDKDDKDDEDDKDDKDEEYSASDSDYNSDKNSELSEESYISIDDNCNK